jgi:hypothetical protein
VDEQTAGELAAAAGVPLAEGRAGILAFPFAAWLAGQNALADALAAPEHDEVEPITAVTWQPRASST